MKLYIRADADAKIGTGHIMRCIALAQTCQDQGGEVTFISRCDSEPLKQRIHDEGFSLIPIDRTCPDPLDLKSTLTTLKHDITDQKTWLVLDGYHFTPDYQKAIRDAGLHLLIIDDMNHLPHYHADILLNQNIHAQELTYDLDEDTTLLLGSKYTLLRREFLKYRGFKHNIPERARNILVTLGGADPDNVTFKVIGALALLDDSAIEVKIVIGPANPYRELLSDALTSTHFVSHLLLNPANIPDLMAWADLAISAAGSTCWELAFMGLPSLLCIVADNQENSVNALVKDEIFQSTEWIKDKTPDEISNILLELIQNKITREKMSQKAKAMVDGKGAYRVIDALDKVTNGLDN